MKLHEIRRMAKGMGIDPKRINKTEIIRAIQKAEGNIVCYGTERVNNCQEMQCLWRSDCLYLQEKY
jgi:type IV pilus biogenesis protein CpaD/CtpE